VAPGSSSAAPTLNDPVELALIAELNDYCAGEGLGPISLPTNYEQLTLAEQALIITNLERVDRGLAPFTGLSSTLDAQADAGVLVNDDPTTSGADAAGVWASTAATAAWILWIRAAIKVGTATSRPPRSGAPSAVSAEVITVSSSTSKKLRCAVTNQQVQLL
jgi:hypothetical protein